MTVSAEGRGYVTQIVPSRRSLSRAFLTGTIEETLTPGTSFAAFKRTVNTDLISQ